MLLIDRMKELDSTKDLSVLESLADTAFTKATEPKNEKKTKNKKGKKDMAEQKWYETTHRWCQTNLTEIDAEICDIGFWK